MKRKDYWNKLFINFILPRMILLSIFTFVFLIYAIQYFAEISILAPPVSWWLVLLVLYILCLLVSTPRAFLTLRTVYAMLNIPSLMFSMLKATFNIKVRRKEFLHTPKSYLPNSTRSKN